MQSRQSKHSVKWSLELFKRRKIGITVACLLRYSSSLVFTRTSSNFVNKLYLNRPFQNRMKRRPCIVMGLFLMLLSQSLAAQTLSFKRIKTPEGSPISGWITDITQDNQGYLWFSSSYAIHRYDGYHIKTYAHDASDANSLVPGNIETIYADSEGFIWIGSQTFGLQRLDPLTGVFTNFRHDPAQRTDYLIIVLSSSWSLSPCIFFNFVTRYQDIIHKSTT